MTEDDRREILAEIAVDEAKRVIRATSRRIGDQAFPTWDAFHDALLIPAVAAVADAVRKSGGSDMLPVKISMRRDAKYPNDPRKVVLVFEGPLFP